MTVPIPENQPPQGPQPQQPQAQQTPAYAPPPSPPAAKRKVWPWILGAIAAVLLACCGISAVIFSSDDKASEPDNSTGQGPGTKQEAGQPGIGTPVRDGRFEFVVQKVACGQDSVGQGGLEQTAQGQYCLVTLSVKNIGDRSQTLADSAQKGIGSNGAEYSTDGLAGIYANGTENQTWLTDINPGNQVTGVIVFDLPKGVELVKLELHDSTFSQGVEVRLK